MTDNLEKEYKISWFKVIGLTVLIAILVIIIVLVYPKNKSNGSVAGNDSVFVNNINLMKEAGFEYFKGSNLPDKIGKTNRMSLEEMVSSNLIVEFQDANGKTCNMTDSYIQATKTLDNEYALKVFLSCEDKTDYIVTTINTECTDCNNKTVVEVKDNNSSNINSSSTNTTSTKNNTSTKGNTAYTPSKSTVINNNYNINYITNCNSCTGSDCKNDCLNNAYYTVSFNSNGGTSVRSQTVRKGATAEYKTTTRNGYAFLGWYLDGEEYDFNTPVTRKITLIAKWKKNQNDNNNDNNNPVKNKYTVRFDSNGGTSVPSQTVTEGARANQPGNPTKACYDFVGWYTDSSLTKKYNFNNGVYQNITLYAKWEDNGSCVETHKVYFDSNGGTSVRTQTVKDGNRASKPSNPTRNGYTFLGWYYNGSEYNFNKRVYQSITLVANWEKDREQYHTYCKIESDRIYSTGYVGKSDIGSSSSFHFNYTLRYTNSNINHVKVVDYGTLSNNDYNRAYNYWKSYNKPIIMINASGNSVDAGSGSNLKRYSLKSNNFSTNVTYNYSSGKEHYFTVRNNLYSLLSITADKFYTSSNYYVYFVPLYFDIEYTDLDQCVDDKASKSNSYRDYEIVDSYYR